jgi:hypothetical protein
MASGVTSSPAAAAVTVVNLGCSRSASGGNISISISNSVAEGDTIIVAAQVVARNPDLDSVTDAAGNSYTKLIKHLGIPVAFENDTHHVYAAFDASALSAGQNINVNWSFSNIIEACAVAVSGLYQSPFDQKASSHANSTSSDSGNTPTTTLVDEVLIGTFGWFCFPGSPCNADATAGTGYTEVIEGQDVMIEYQTVSSTGAFKATATLDASSDWIAAITTFKVDTTPPVITPNVSGTLGNNGWYTSDVTVSWTVTDPESRVTSTCSPTTISSDTAGIQINCQATSAGGTSSNSITIKRDATPPTPIHSGPFVVDEGSAITLDGTSSSDGLSGVQSTAWALDGDSVFDDGDPASFSRDDGLVPAIAHPVSLKVVDLAGNEATANTQVTVTNVDPTATFANTTGTIFQGESVTLTFSNPFDPSTADTTTGFTYLFDCTDNGSFEQSGAATSFDCPYPSSGNFTARGRIEDKDGGATDNTVAVSVLSPSPFDYRLWIPLVFKNFVPALIWWLTV